MATRYLIAYDIADPDRLRQVYLIMRTAGERVQDSLYEALLTAREQVLLEGRLARVLNLAEDQVLFIDLGDAERKNPVEIKALGVRYRPIERGTLIV